MLHDTILIFVYKILHSYNCGIFIIVIRIVIQLYVCMYVYMYNYTNIMQKKTCFNSS